MKYKITITTALLILFNCINSKAENFNCLDGYHRYAIITAIEKELNQAKSVEEIRSVALKMYAIVFKNFSDTCPPPKKNDYLALCTDIGSRAKVPSGESDYYEYTYEKRILLLACVDVRVDNEETIKNKVQLFWNKYKTNCHCDSVVFPVQNGNILKFALANNLPQVIETLAGYDCDINFIDPADNLNLLDYVISEITRLKQQQNSKNTVMVYEKYRDNIIFMGGKSTKK